MSFRLSLLQNSHGRHPDLTGGETEGGPRPTLRRTQNWRGLVGWALAHLQSRSLRAKRRVLQGARLRVIGTGLLLAFVAPLAIADDVRPVQVLVKELPSGAFDVQWSVPKVIRPQTMPSPRLPEQCRPDGERTFVDQPSAWLNRQVYRCPEGLAGQELGISFPYYNIGLSTLLRVELLSGESYAHILNPGEDSWRIPEANVGGISSFLREAQKAAVEGVRHFLTSWVHLAFLLMLSLLGSVRVGVRLATAFFLAQVVGVIFGWLSGFQLAAPLAEIAVAVATVLLAREALRPPESRMQLTVLAACAGVAHGLGIANIVSLSGREADPSVLSLLLFVLGMDAALLISVTVVAGIGRLVPGRPAHAPFHKVAVYGVAGMAFAVAIGAVIKTPIVEAKDGDRQLRLPSMLTPSGSAAIPGSRRVASNNPNAVFQSFLAVEAFEIRHEILVRLKDVAELVGLSPGPELGIEAQSEVKERIRELVEVRMSLEIDGEVLQPVSQRIDFMTVDEKGVLPRPIPVPELVETALVGITDVYMMTTTARDLSLTWEFIEGVMEIPATVTDPESTRSIVLMPRQPVLDWQNELAQDPVPKVSAIVVEPTEITVPLWSLVPFAAALFFAVRAARRRKPAVSFAIARVVLVVAILLGPFGNLAIAVPWSVGSAPSASQAKRILAGVLPNIYRALEFREESVVFDRLALSVTGDTLTEVYLDQRKVLVMEERGGARARVEAVEVIEVDSIQPESSGGFSAEAIWTVGGTVTHFGHRHFRQNRYDARVALVPDEGIWKVRLIEVLNEERLR